MSDRLYWNSSTLVLPQGQGTLRLFQVHDRRNVLASTSMMSFIDLLTGGCTLAEAQAAYESAAPAITLADATAFSLWDHAYSNSDFLDKTVDASQLTALPWSEALELLSEHRLIVDQWPPPRDSDKRHFADRFRGTFYEQVATESLFNRTTPTEWWTAQKFEADHKSIRQTPYRFIEEHFLGQYFAEHLAGADVLDIGCGTGYFTEFMARYARRVVGVDYNADYVDICRRSRANDTPGRLDFQVGDIIDLSNGNPAFAQEKFDYITMIDMFLFLFDGGYQPVLYENRNQIMENLRRLMKPGGRIFTMDPHPLWLTPWVGSADAPFGVLTEYRRRRFKVIPTLEEVTTFFCEHGLRVRRVYEPQISAEYQAIDATAHAWMDNVPQWWCFELEQA